MQLSNRTIVMAASKHVRNVLAKRNSKWQSAPNTKLEEVDLADCETGRYKTTSCRKIRERFNDIAYIDDIT